MAKIRIPLQFSILNILRITLLLGLAVVVTPMWQDLGKKITNSRPAWATV